MCNSVYIDVSIFFSIQTISFKKNLNCVINSQLQIYCCRENYSNKHDYKTLLLTNLVSPTIHPVKMPLVKNSSLELGTNINLLLVKGSLKMQIPTRHFTIFNVSLILLYQGWNIYYKCRKCECNKSRDYMTEFFCKKQSSTMNYLDSNPFLIFPFIVFSIMSWSSTDSPLFLYLYQTLTICMISIFLLLFFL